MPKIKTSALISDIKGSANGSVFARNSGGLYYRNQPSVSPKKTAKFARSQSIFRSTVSEWKKLTPEQMHAWDEFAQGLDVNNVWGLPRNVSGYEAYNKCNLQLKNANLPPILVPAPANPWPAIAESCLVAPEEVQYNPSFLIFPYGRDKSQIPDGHDGDILMSLPVRLSELQTVPVNAVPSLSIGIGLFVPLSALDGRPSADKIIFGDIPTERDSMSVMIMNSDADFFNIGVGFKDFSENSSAVLFSRVQFADGFNRIGIFVPTSENIAPMLIVNGNIYVGDFDDDYDTVDFAGAFGLSLISKQFSDMMQYGLSHFVISASDSSPSLAMRMGSGYIPDSPLYAVSVDSFHPASVYIRSLPFSDEYHLLENPKEWELYGRSLSVQSPPLLSVVNPDTFNPDFIYKVEVLGNCSFGVNSPRGQWQTLALFKGNGAEFFPLGLGYAREFYSALGGATAFARITIIDPSNGLASAPTLLDSMNVGLDFDALSEKPPCSDQEDLYECAHEGPGPRGCICPDSVNVDIGVYLSNKRAKKRKVKFKAGSELSNAVK